MAWQGKTLTGAQVQMRQRHLAHDDASRFLPDLTRVKSGRACLPLDGRVPRPPRQARPDLPAVSQDYPPLPCGLRLRATDRATLHRSVTLSVRVPSSERDEGGYEVSPHPGSVLDIAGTMTPTCPQVLPFNHAVSSADDVGNASNIAGGKRRTAAQRQSSENLQHIQLDTPPMYISLEVYRAEVRILRALGLARPFLRSTLDLRARRRPTEANLRSPLKQHAQNKNQGDAHARPTLPRHLCRHVWPDHR
jgi:hypothetical protein